ncbi:MAG TPA: TonB family protein [Candidatus Acidoferrum sp.]|nr:TonB family protein [Candidatus Acidoferrum sp.]
MSDVWTQSEGQVVDNKFRLIKYLAGTEHSAVFLTELPAPQSKKAAIKFIAADPSTADRQLSAWSRASRLSHPHLLQIFYYGRCRLERMDLLYVVLQYADEDLSQVIPERALTALETREMLNPLLEGLAYIHEKGFVHAHILPANVHAADDKLKLAADTIVTSGDTRPSLRKLDVYDAPETESSPLNTSSDVWSLGATLVEILTQHPPVMPLDSQSNPTFPDNLQQPFLDIACHSLRRDSNRRWTAAEIVARLNPTAAAAAAGQTQSPSTLPASAPSPAAASATSAVSSMPAAPVSVPPAAISPLAIPLSNEPAVPAARLPTPQYQGPSQRVPVRPRPASGTGAAPKETVVLPNYVVPLVAAILVIVAIIALPKILSRRPNSSSAASASASPASQPKSAPPSARAETHPNAKSVQPSFPKTTPGKKPPEKSGASASPAPAAAALRTDTFPSANAASSSGVSPARGEVLDQILPDVSEKARATIHGRVRVSVRASVDAAGNVSNAELDSRGPSQYFADLALNAARRWEFTGPEIDGRSVPSVWLIRFEFSQNGTQAFPKQIAP